MKIKQAKISGKITVPSSKSVAQRAIAAATLAKGTSVLHNVSFSDDVKAAVKLAKSLGATVKQEKSTLIIEGNFRMSKDELFAGEAGLSTRMFLPVAALSGKNFTLNGSGTILKRPMSNLVEPMQQFGVDVKTTNGFLPLHISGKLKANNAQIDASETSQLLSGLLMALPLAEEKSELKVNNLKSKPYIDLTIEIMQEFGVNIENFNYEKFTIEPQIYTPAEIMLEGDWSGAAFWFVAGAIAGDLQISGLNSSSKQADIAILDALKKANVDVRFADGDYFIKKSDIKAFYFDASDCPDLFPPLAVLSAFANGESKIKGVHRLLHKESNRAKAIVEEFKKLSIPVKIDGDYLIIKGVKNIPSAKFETYNDHRMAMAATVLGLKSKNGIEIKNWQCVSKSYPTFFDDFQLIS